MSREQLLVDQKHDLSLTIMCSATRFADAVPPTETVVKALLKFFSVFGLPKVIQTCHDSRVMSMCYVQIMVLCLVFSCI